MSIFILQLLDRLLFAIALIIGMQVPAFIQEYYQRLAGHLAEATRQLFQFKHIADNLYQGDLAQLVNHYLLNADHTIQQTGNLLQQLMTRQAELQRYVDHLQATTYPNKLYYFITEFDHRIGLATWSDFHFTIPLELPAIVTGVTFSISLMLMIRLFTALIKRLIRTRAY